MPRYRSLDEIFDEPDELVPPSNAQFLVKHLRDTASPRLILLPDGDHYLPWTHRDTISQAIDYTIRDCA